MKTFEVMTSVCDRVTLINGEVTRSGVMCGFAFIDAYCTSPILFADGTRIALSEIHANRPNSITLSSERDDIQFAIAPLELCPQPSN